MAIFTYTLEASGDASGTWLITADSPPVLNESFIIGKDQWALLPKGRLKSFINKAYPSQEAFVDAMTSADISCFLLGQDALGQLSWYLDAEGYPAVETYNLSLSRSLVVRVILPHSTSI